MDPKHETISLIADSGIQCIDYLIDASKLRFAKDYRFHTQTSTVESTARKTVESQLVHPMEGEIDESDDEPRPPDELEYRSLINPSVSSVEFEDTYMVTIRRAMEAFDRQWLPVPYFRQLTNTNEFVEGPSNWARIYLAAPEIEGDPYRVVIGFDTELCERSDNKPYAGPESDDASATIRFRVSSDIGTQCKYAGSDWQRNWIQHCYLAGMNRRMPEPQPGRPQRTHQVKDPGEPWAHFVVLLQALPRLTTMPSIRLVKAVEDADQGKMSPGELRERFVDVDLVLDIGNSRTCGLLAEFGAGRDSVGLGAQPPSLLRMREISRPERVSAEPFESRVEFNQADFGLSAHGRRSGRPSGKDAFWWPSPLRVGNEAAWLATQTEGRSGASGMSSPKRYVWDDTRRPRSWVNNESSKQVDGRVPPIAGPIPAMLTEDGRLRRKQPYSLKTSYSRGSIYMLMIAEILCHAIAQINSPSYRYNRSDSDLPRRLRKVIITLPSATPLSERDRMRYYANKAKDLVWQAYGWQKNDPLHPALNILLNWDEATCTQLVFLYNELEHRFQEFPRAFFELYGRDRRGEYGAALRIATIDIGGGTTDLMIIDHELNDQLILPKQLFREGVRIAGDDILKDVIQKIVLPAFVAAGRAYGADNPDRTVSYLFGGDLANSRPEDQVRRALFVNRVFIPIAIRLLAEYEKSAHELGETYAEFTVSEVVDKGSVTADVIDYLASAFTRQGQEPFDLMSVAVTMRPMEMAGAGQAVMGNVLRDFCDVVKAYDCDLLLTSGRPTAMPVVHDIIRAAVPTTPDRIVPMYGYEVGNWYPYRSTDSRIWDPKTTAAVGAMLCHLCEGDYAHFSIDTKSLRPKSTARFIGRMNSKGQISNDDDDLLFENLSDDDSAFKEFKAQMTTKLDIGYRQLPYERWATSQLYGCQFLSPDIARNTDRPITLKMKRKEDHQEDSDDRLADRAKEDFEIVEILDRNKNQLDKAATLTGSGDDLPLQTFFGTVDQVESGYWIDSGVLSTLEIIDRD